MLAFQRDILVSYFSLEDEDSRFLKNVGVCQQVYIVPNPEKRHHHHELDYCGNLKL
jgi:hypothetical protein